MRLSVDYDELRKVLTHFINHIDYMMCNDCLYYDNYYDKCIGNKTADDCVQIFINNLVKGS